MKLRFVILFSVLGLLGAAFSPLFQDTVPPRPTIRIGVGTQIASEEVYSYCWPVAVGNNQCDFALEPAPANRLTIDAGAVINIIIDNSPGNPSSLVVNVSNTQGVQSYNLTPAPEAIFDETLAPGNNRLEVVAQYANVAETEGYITFVFEVNVLPEASPTAAATNTPSPIPTATQAPSLTPVPTKEVAEEATPTEEGAVGQGGMMATEEAQEATEAATEEVTEEATEEVEVTEEAAEVATEEVAPEATDEVTEAPTEEVTQEATEAATEEVTEEATEEVEATEAVTEEATEAAVPVATEEATEAAPADLPSQQPPPVRPTLTTVPLPGETQPTQEAQPATEVAAQPTPPPPPPAPEIVQPEQPPNVQLGFAGQVFNPAGVNFCQVNPSGQRICVESPLANDGQEIALLQNFAVQIRLDGPRPGSVGFMFLDASTLSPVQAESRAGDRLILFNISVPPGRYLLRVDIDWNGTRASYFFRVRVSQ